MTYRKGKEIKESPKYIIIDEGTVKKLIVKKCTVEDTMEYSAVAINMKTSSKMKVEGRCCLKSMVICRKLFYRHNTNCTFTF